MGVWPKANGSGDLGLEHVGQIMVGGEWPRGFWPGACWGECCRFGIRDSVGDCGLEHG